MITGYVHKVWTQCISKRHWQKVWAHDQGTKHGNNVLLTKDVGISHDTRRWAQEMGTMNEAWGEGMSIRYVRR